jgi:hypothetical protein
MLTDTTPSQPQPAALDLGRATPAKASQDWKVVPPPEESSESGYRHVADDERVDGGDEYFDVRGRQWLTVESNDNRLRFTRHTPVELGLAFRRKLKEGEEPPRPAEPIAPQPRPAVNLDDPESMRAEAAFKMQVHLQTIAESKRPPREDRCEVLTPLPNCIKPGDWVCQTILDELPAVRLIEQRHESLKREIATAKTKVDNADPATAKLPNPLTIKQKRLKLARVTAEYHVAVLPCLEMARLKLEGISAGLDQQYETVKAGVIEQLVKIGFVVGDGPGAIKNSQIERAGPVMDAIHVKAWVIDQRTALKNAVAKHVEQAIVANSAAAFYENDIRSVIQNV